MPKVRFRATPADGGKVAHRWDIIADNGRIIGSSSESYERRIDAISNLSQVAAAIIEWGRTAEVPIPGDHLPEQGTTGPRSNLRADWVHPGREE